MKRGLVGVSALAVLCSIALLIIDANYMKVKYTCQDRIILAQTFEELQEVSDLIVRARVLPGGKAIPYDLGYGVPMVYDVTFTPVKVEAVFKGSVAEEEIITIFEEYYVIEAGLGKTLWLTGDYLPAREKEQYVFFLYDNVGSERFGGTYGVVDLEYGKYLVTHDNIDTLSDKEIQLGAGHYCIVRGENNQYRDWYKKVLELYD